MRIATLAAALVIAVTSAAIAHDYRIGSIEIEAPWTRAMPPGAKVGGGFMVITNTGNEADRLIALTSPRAARGEIHEMTMQEGIMKMREVAGGLEIAPGESVELKPGGYHVMFMDVTEGFREGERIPATLMFEKAGEITVEFVATGVGAKQAPAHMH
ncbi:hypothetical protein EDC22_101242 [Tepidamorphus gemmatus]|uniref:Copper(I)-binding protein n=1 Tax=Tepidamorphus gemmatus TaxID=747076 RepID=A0A4R3MHX8_9HYPH|nr:copper chaperone PCu(A)C [Tepidamorphus gemmatus]TCT13377.1 hypothetical protein EDC22_101242 [Tepidamorphus gemmatus]